MHKLLCLVCKYVVVPFNRHIYMYACIYIQSSFRRSNAATRAQVATGALSVGDMTSFLLYSTFLAVNFGGLTGVYSQASRTY